MGRGGRAPEITGGGADKRAFRCMMMVVIANDGTGDAPDQYVVRDLRAEDLSLCRRGKAGSTYERKQESFHTLIKTLEKQESLGLAIFLELSGNLMGGAKDEAPYHL